MERVVIEIDSESELKVVAREVLERAAINDRRVIAFYGEMGAGKTTLIREIATQLGVVDTVTSPTFALINQYATKGGGVVNHFDFYRIERIEEAFDIGYEEYFYGGDLCLIEWAEKVEELLPVETMVVKIDVDPEKVDRRIFTILY